MIKTLKKAISIFVLAVFILSLVPMVTLAAQTYYTTPEAMPWTGNNVPSARMVNSDGIGVTQTSYNSTAKKTIPIMLYEEGTYGKVSSDAVYKIYDYPGRTGVSVSGNGDFTTSPSSSINTKDIVLEFSFAYEKAGANDLLVQSYFRTYNDYNRNKNNYGYITNMLLIATNGIKFHPSATSNPTSASISTEYHFDPFKWYNVEVIFDFENKVDSAAENVGSYTYMVYVNGEKVHTKTVTTAKFGLSTTRTIPAYNSVMYWDNINVYGVDDAAEFTSREAAQANLVSNSSDVVIEDDSIRLVNYNATVGDVKSAVQNSIGAGNKLRVYNSDYSAELSNSDKALGSNFVIAGNKTLTIDGAEQSVENTYTYYNVEKWLYSYNGINDGSSATKAPVGKSGSVSGKNIVFEIKSDGIGGKEIEKDKYIEVSAISAGQYMTIATATGTGADVLEFSILMTPECTGLGFEISLNRGTDSYDNFASSISVSKNEIYFSRLGADNPKRLIADIETNKWYNIAFVSPQGVIGSDADGNDLYDPDFEVYVNGKLEARIEHGYESENGFYRATRVRGSNPEGSTTPSAYIDNVRVYNNEAFNPQHETEAELSGAAVDTIAKTITVQNAKVSDIKNALNVEDGAIVRIYDENDVLVTSDAQDVEDGYTVVAVATNGTEMERTYSYYNIRVADGKILYNVPTISVSNNSATACLTAYNYTGADVTHYIYLASYYDGELMDLKPVPYVATNGISTSPAQSVIYGDDYTAKFFVWENDGITPVLAATEK